MRAVLDFTLDNFEQPAELPRLADDEVHIWLVDLDASDSHIEHLQKDLSSEELARAGKFKFERDRKRYIVAHGELRHILGHYLRVDPSRLKFLAGPQGKPELLSTVEAKPPCFNLSHSASAALIGVTDGRRIGIDIEYIHREFDRLELAARFFAPGEVAKLQRLPSALQPQAFFNCWTRKEAYIKAQGLGLQLPLKDFEVSLIPGEPAALLRTENDVAEASCWRLEEIPIGPHYIGALAVEGHDWKLRCFQSPTNSV